MQAYKMGITKEQFVAENSVKLVRNYFKKMGYKTTAKSKPTANGYDLVVLKDEKSFSIEVKTAFLNSRSWQVGKTHNKENDFIAIVFPNKKIHFELWKDHKEKCTKNGKRSLTKIASLYV